MTDQIHIQATNGERCFGETHQFRLGAEVPDSIGFRANDRTFHAELEAALIRHGKRHGARPYWNLQVRGAECTAEYEWRNIQNPATGGVMAITAEVAGAEETIATLYKWACNTVQMLRDIHALADGMANLGTDER